MKSTISKPDKGQQYINTNVVKNSSIDRVHNLEDDDEAILRML